MIERQWCLFPLSMPSATISQYDYTYDAVVHRIARAHSGTAFAQPDMFNYAYNAKSELTNAVASVDSNYTYAYDFDEIGNRELSSERGTNMAYVPNNLNQYTSVDDFTPLFDADGNQTLVKTATGIWQVTYNCENSSILWTCGDTNIVMSCDRNGRRVTKNDQRFVYDGYLQIANRHSTSTPTPFITSPDWDYGGVDTFTGLPHRPHSNWYDLLPDCPCPLKMDPLGKPLSDQGLGERWSAPNKDDLNGKASYQLTWSSKIFDPGQQCMYDSCGRLINVGESAGTPDYYAHTGFSIIGNFAMTPLHILFDGLFYLHSTEFDRFMRPPNMGRDSETGLQCPENRCD